ncbi:hypothetical protein V8D89_005794 [Ganoderma adspersum]
MTSPKARSLAGIAEQSEVAVETIPPISADAELGGYETRRRLERHLARRLDMRLSILVVTFILSYSQLHIALVSS